ncbi:hypothetical protein F5Y15DRAFT_403155 [Xylariaceae sp. FL0016]|nr:hypothetical protein F5Y15DRAFT_403155 [Xylariaceae sp. FL0016]
MALKRVERKLDRKWSQWIATIKSNLMKNHLWQRMLKNTICTTITLIIGIVPAVVAVYGKSTFLGAMASAFGHPGQRFGQMTEVLCLIMLGTFVGIGWGMFGLYLSSLVYHYNVEAAWAIRAVFFTLALLIHGVLRASTPRLFMFVFWFLLINLTILTNSATAASTSMVTQIAYPIMTAIGVIVLVNITVFPEFSSSFLGTKTIETLCEAVSCCQEAGEWFMTDSRESKKDNGKKSAELRARLITLTDKKAKLRTQLGSCSSAQAECNFELVFSVLPPRSLKSISMTMMARLVQVTIGLVNACESKFAMAGYGHHHELEKAKDSEESGDESSNSSSSRDSDESSDTSDDSDGKPRNGNRSHRQKSRYRRDLELVKPIKEIASGDVDLLDHIMSQVRIPAQSLKAQIHDATQVITTALAFCYDVPKLPSGALAPEGILLEEIDLRLEIFSRALAQFDIDSAEALENAAAMCYGNGLTGDLMPRMETHLVSSFLIDIRYAAFQIMDMLKQARFLVEKRQSRLGRRRLHWPRISWKKWLTSGGDQDRDALPEYARKEARTGRGIREDSRNAADDDDFDTSLSSESDRQKGDTDEEAGIVLSKETSMPVKGKIPRRKGPQKSDASDVLWLRGLAADLVEFFADSDALAFALKMCVAAFIVTWPGFVPSWNHWYASVRGTWASLQLILVFEVSVGTSFQGFFLRAAGTVFGCTVGFAAYKIGQGNLVVLILICFLGIIPSSYVHLSTPYVKTGLISIVSLSVVGLATVVQSNTDEPWQIYLKRMICFLIGGTVALSIEMTLFPVRARDRLVESLAASINQISNMEETVAVGIDSKISVDIRAHAMNEGFVHAKEKAEQALGAARTFLPFCLTEPRIKGSFKGQAMIYGEIIYVLFQIIDRMNNMLHIRRAYGSSVLEEFQAEVLPFRRNVTGSMKITLFAVHEALTTRLPLPQFLPSSRVAQLRYVSRVREVLLERAMESARASGVQTPATVGSRHGSIPLQGHGLRSVTRQSFLAWNAASAGVMEIIEYLEELVDLAKLLVGVNAFRTGMLERPRFHEYISRIKARQAESAAVESERVEMEKTVSKASDASKGRNRLKGFSFGRRPTMPSQGVAGSAFGTGLKRRRTALGNVTPGGGDGAADGKESDEVAVVEEDDLPMSLQRVMTRRMEGNQRNKEPRIGIEAGSGVGSGRRRYTADPKGKGALRKAGTWMG